MQRPLPLALVALAACSPAATDATDTDDTDTQVADTDIEPQNSWWIDDEEHPALYRSLNCEMNGALLRLSAVDTGGVGSIQLLLGERPTADASLTVVNPDDLNTVAAGQIYVSIGRDRESANQYEATSGTVAVTVVTTDPQEINLTFTNLPATTGAAATAELSGNVGARDGTFVGACDFDSL